MAARPALAAGLLVFVLLAAGCGGKGHENSSGSTSSLPGAKVFDRAGCGGCHTLSAAKSKGTVGPDLDQLRPDAQTVERQVRNGGVGMPSFSKKLNEVQISQVDRDQLFYAMARGLTRSDAERLILRGFFQDVLDRIELEPVREALGEALEARIPQG